MTPTRCRVTRLGHGPIIRPHMDGRMGDNVNGPSLIRAPDWIENPLGRYYLYFAHHEGRYIRLACADDLAGPWSVHEPGVLPLTESHFRGHIASPDVHVDHAERRIRLYYHGADGTGENHGPQWTRVATSTDGLRFVAHETRIAEAYLRVVPYLDGFLGMAMPGVLYRSRTPLGDFEQGPTLFDPNMRHCALKRHRDRLLVFFSRVGDRPEHILLSEVALTADWHQWQATPPRSVLAPGHEFEGSDRPLRASVRGLAGARLHELRDPAIFEDGDELYLLYSVAGESGIAIAHLALD